MQFNPLIGFATFSLVISGCVQRSHNDSLVRDAGSMSAEMALSCPSAHIEIKVGFEDPAEMQIIQNGKTTRFVAVSAKRELLDNQSLKTDFRYDFGQGNGLGVQFAQNGVDSISLPKQAAINCDAQINELALDSVVSNSRAVQISEIDQIVRSKFCDELCINIQVFNGPVTFAHPYAVTSWIAKRGATEVANSQGVFKRVDGGWTLLKEVKALDETSLTEAGVPSAFIKTLLAK